MTSACLGTMRQDAPRRPARPAAGRRRSPASRESASSVSGSGARTLGGSARRRSAALALARARSQLRGVFADRDVDARPRATSQGAGGLGRRRSSGPHPWPPSVTAIDGAVKELAVLSPAKRRAHATARRDGEALMSDRESMEYDVVIVGAGPAGLTAAIRLKQLAAADRPRDQRLRARKGQRGRRAHPVRRGDRPQGARRADPRLEGRARRWPCR